MAKKVPTKQAKPQNLGSATVAPPEKIEMPEATATDNTVSVPREQVRFQCPKHGDITNATLHLSFADAEGNQQGQYLYCLHCLNEVLLSLQKAGAIETVQIVIPDELAKQMGAPLKEEAVADSEPAQAADPTAALQVLAGLQQSSETE